jgi:hypothetical protein
MFQIDPKPSLHSYLYLNIALKTPHKEQGGAEKALKRNLLTYGSRGFKPFSELTLGENVLLPINLMNDRFAKP